MTYLDDLTAKRLAASQWPWIWRGYHPAVSTSSRRVANLQSNRWREDAEYIAALAYSIWLKERTE